MEWGSATAERPVRPKHRLGLGYKFINHNGYVMVLVGKDHPGANLQGFLLEHRLVMANKLGRELRRFESVHHRNGIKTDNAEDNLELWATIQPAGQRVEDLVAHARRILELYG